MPTPVITQIHLSRESGLIGPYHQGTVFFMVIMCIYISQGKTAYNMDIVLVEHLFMFRNEK
jgi:hypothetical protein